MLTYVHWYDLEGNYLGHGKILDVEPTVGYVHERYQTEGYTPWIIERIVPRGVSFGNAPLIEAHVKVLPYVKTHCDHSWKTLALTSRECVKCNERQKFDYGLAMWKKVDAQV